MSGTSAPGANASVPAGAAHGRFCGWEGAIVAFAALAVFARTVGYPLVWDDHFLLESVKGTVAHSGFSGLLAAEFTTRAGFHSGFYRPVVLLSLWLETLVSPPLPHIHHLTNVLLHAFNSVLVFHLLRTLAGSGRAALAGALVFALHPVHVESVAFVSGRTDLLAAAFILVAALAWLKSNQAVEVRPRHLAGGLAAFSLALLSKELAFFFPAVLLTADLFGLWRAGGGAMERLSRNRSWYLGLAGVVVAVLVLRRVAGIALGVAGGGGLPFAPLDSDAGDQALGPLKLLTYARLLLAPWHLSAYYTAADLAPGLTAAIAALVLAGLLAAGFRGGERRPILLAFLWMVGFLLPSLGLVRIGGAAVAERFLYLPSVGFALLAAAVYATAARSARARVLAPLIAAIILIALGARSFARAAVWRDEVALFGDLARTAPGYPGAHNSLGDALRRAGRPAEAREALQRALVLRPSYFEALVNLGLTSLEMGDDQQGVLYLRQAIGVRSDLAGPHAILGRALLVQGRYAEAAESYRTALALDPALPSAHTNLGIAYANEGRHEQAEASFRSAIRARPGDAVAHFNLGLALARRKRLAEARAELEELARLDQTLAGKLAAQIGR